LGLAVDAPKLDVSVSAFLVLLESALLAFLGHAVGELDDLLRMQTTDVALDPLEKVALLLVVRRLLALTEELDEHGNVIRHVFEASRPGRLGAGPEYVHGLEIELTRVQRGVFFRVV
jgi:hypothetical protein